MLRQLEGADDEGLGCELLVLSISYFVCKIKDSTRYGWGADQIALDGLQCARRAYGVAEGQKGK
jgi:hypothetical protein